MAAARTTHRYPRPGEPIAPETLREVLFERAPKRLRRKVGEEDLLLCDLDETVWDRFPPEIVVELSKVVVGRVAAYHARKVFQRRHFPMPPEGIGLEDLRLENRTRRCLAREGFDDDLSALGELTLSKVLAIRAFGPRCLVDLLSALESPRVAATKAAKSAEAALSEELRAEARRLAELPEAESVRSEDPRFTRLMQTIDPDAATALELAEGLVAGTQHPADPAFVIDQIRQLVSRIQNMPNLTLEQELIQVFGSTPYERNRRILIGYYGWEDGQQHTLTQIGNRFGITRERIRQVCAKLTKKHKKIKSILAPVMDRVLALVEERLPCPAEKLEAELAEKGLTAVGLPLESVAAGAGLLGRVLEFKIVKVDPGKIGAATGVSRLAVRPDQVAPTLAIIDLAKKEIYFHGVATVEKIDEMTSDKFPGSVGRELVSETLMLIDGFSWLDEEEGWFWLRPIAKHGLPKAIDKILAVAGEVSVEQMRTAMSRNRRLWKDPPPENVLLEYCRQMPGIRVQGERIIADPPRDWKKSLTGVEAQLVEVLKEHGPIMERGEMEDLCVASGMNRFSFHAFVSWSPVIAQFGHSVYGLLGAKTSQKRVDKLLATRRAKRLTHRVLDNHGLTPDGKVWLSYRLSKAASTYAVITIPAALKRVVRGRFKLIDPDGEQIGVLATKDGRAWGLGAFMRQHGAQIGDYVVLTLDLKKRTATVELGKEPE